jgi:hypothetical protein
MLELARLLVLEKRGVCGRGHLSRKMMISGGHANHKGKVK